jgi:hypothetical protein
MTETHESKAFWLTNQFYDLQGIGDTGYSWLALVPSDQGFEHSVMSILQKFKLTSHEKENIWVFGFS